MTKATGSKQISPRAFNALVTIARFQTGQWKYRESLCVSPRMWNILIAAGMVEAEPFYPSYTNGQRCHRITDAGEEAVGDAVDTPN